MLQFVIQKYILNKNLYSCYLKSIYGIENNLHNKNMSYENHLYKNILETQQILVTFLYTQRNTFIQWDSPSTIGHNFFANTINFSCVWEDNEHHTTRNSL